MSTFVRRRARWTATAAVAALAPVSIVVFGPIRAAAAGPTCGETVTANLTLTANLDCSTFITGPALDVGANGITINLNGHTITGPGGVNGTDGIFFGSAEALGFVTVENGTIQDFKRDVHVEAARNLTLKSLTLHLDGTTTYDGLVAANVAKGSFSGLKVTNAAAAIDVEQSAQVRISGSHVTSSQIGFFAEFDSNGTWTKDTASGITAADAAFEDFESSGDAYTYDVANNNSRGFLVNDDFNGPVTLSHDTADMNTLGGIFLEDNTPFISSAGVVTTEVVTANTANDNGGDGIFEEFSQLADVSGNTASSNHANGIELTEPRQYTVDANVTNHNTQTGIRLVENIGGGNVTAASQNTAEYNGDYGLHADSAAPGSGNVALHNTPFDCFNFVCGPGSTHV